MTNLIAIGVGAWIIIGIVALIVLSVILHFINREFRIRYGLNLFGGGLLMILAIGGFVLGYFGLKGDLGKGVGFLGIGVAIFLIVITLIYNCKKCGGIGFLALICQILFAPASLILLLEFFTSNGRSMTYGTYSDRRDIRRAREDRKSVV